MLLVKSSQICPVCHSGMENGLESWHFVCTKCEYEYSRLEPKINELDSHSLVDEKARPYGLEMLRKDNFLKIMKAISELKGIEVDILEVGPAHGWFMEIAKVNGFTIQGLEPDQVMFNALIKKGFLVQKGYFPQDLSKSIKYDVIIFNDVIEHIPALQATINAAYDAVFDNGLVILNLPLSTGIFYKVSKLIRRVGIKQPFSRMWQEGLPSPHLHYFNEKNIIKIMESSNFRLESTFNLDSIRLKGLYHRIMHVNKIPAPLKIIIYFLVLLFLPFVNLFAKDIGVFIFSKK